MKTLKLRSKKSGLVAQFQELLKSAGYSLSVDGIFGRQTFNNVLEFQRKNNLVIDGIVGPKTWQTLMGNVISDDSNIFLSEQDLIDAAEKLGVELAVVKAVNEVESNGKGFLPQHKPKILFEGHVFRRRLARNGFDPKEYAKDYPTVLYRSWTKAHYLGGIREYERVFKAAEINLESAYESTSWGLYQIMGHHWKALGYKSIFEFVDLMHYSEGEHLKAFVKYIQVNHLTKYLKDKDFAGFAYRYNGSGYKANKYDIKMERAYKKYKKMEG